ncbi:membrane hypothetical protein [Vibrio chagasii]|nr:membrane hypothetical protein [Vibrio chagasii]
MSEVTRISREQIIIPPPPKKVSFIDSILWQAEHRTKGFYLQLLLIPITAMIIAGFNALNMHFHGEPSFKEPVRDGLVAIGLLMTCISNSWITTYLDLNQKFESSINVNIIHNVLILSIIVGCSIFL